MKALIVSSPVLRASGVQDTRTGRWYRITEIRMVPQDGGKPLVIAADRALSPGLYNHAEYIAGEEVAKP